MDLLEIAPRESWAAWLGGVHERTGMTASLYDAEGKALLRHDAWANDLCPEIQGSDAARTTICAVAHRALARQAQVTRAPQVDACDLGMIKFVVPIFDGETFLGAAGACGALPADEAVETFLASQALSKPEPEVVDLAHSVPRATPAQVQDAIDYLMEQLADHAR